MATSIISGFNKALAAGNGTVTLAAAEALAKKVPQSRTSVNDTYALENQYLSQLTKAQAVDTAALAALMNADPAKNPKATQAAYAKAQEVYSRAEAKLSAAQSNLSAAIAVRDYMKIFATKNTTPAVTSQTIYDAANMAMQTHESASALVKTKLSTEFDVAGRIYGEFNDGF